MRSNSRLLFVKGLYLLIMFGYFHAALTLLALFFYGSYSGLGSSL